MLTLPYNKTDIRFTHLLSFIGIACIIFGARLDIINMYSAVIPYWDDWGHGGFIHKFATIGITFEDLARPSNRHRQVFAKLLDISLFKLNMSQWDTTLTMVVNSMVWTLSGLVLIAIAWVNRTIINAPFLILLIIVLWVFPISLVNTVWGAQIHNYFMILLAVVGCWGVTHTPYTKTWWLSIFCIMAIPLTLAGGSLLPVSIACVYWLICIFKANSRYQHLPTAIATSIIGALGLTLVLIQPSGVASNFTWLKAISTIASSLSWPLTEHLWPSLIFLLPVLILLYQVLIKGHKLSQLAIFALCLYGFIFLVCLSLGLVRPYGGPTRRYFEFLALGFISSTIILLVLQDTRYKLNRWLNHTLIVAWFIILISSIPWQKEVFDFTLKDRNLTTQAQMHNVRAFTLTQDPKHLRYKPFRHIPFPSADRLADSITNFQKIDMLPFNFQFYGALKPEKLAIPVSKVLDSTLSEQLKLSNNFVSNGTINENTEEIGLGFFEEPVMGSYVVDQSLLNKTDVELSQQNQAGNRSTGTFISQTYHLKRPNVMIPIVGHLGADEKLSLTLINIDTGTSISVNPPKDINPSPEVWRNLFLKVPVGNYQLIASDNSEESWFGIASPRTLGPLSFLTLKALDLGHLLWKFGLILLFFANQNLLVKTFSIRSNN